MFSNIEKNMEVGLAAIPPWLKELSYASDTMSDRHSEGNLHLKNKLQNTFSWLLFDGVFNSKLI